SFTSENANTAFRDATAMSAAATSPAPPPSACPCTRATTGAGQASIASSIVLSAFASATFASYERSTEARIHSTSAPAEKLGPSPASRTTRVRPTSANASASSAISAASKALRLSGRASVMRSTGPSRSIRSAATRRELRLAAMLRGALAAAVTPLREGAFDEDAVAAYVEFLAGHGLDGILVLGTTGEGVLFSVDERREIAAAFVDAGRDRLQVAVHCGAQTTADTAALAEHAAVYGADAVVVIAPPYFPLDEEELLAHLDAAARACAPLPFYVYEFAARSGYAIPPAVVERLRERAPNLAGLKVSDSPWERVAPYLLD